MMKQILQGVAMMEVIAVETAPIQIFVPNVHAMMKEHCHLIYPVSQGSISNPSGKTHCCKKMLFIEPD